MSGAGSPASRVRDLRARFASGRTRPLAWRREQLEGLARLLAEEEPRLAAALAADLGKPPFESWVTEIGLLRREARFALAQLEAWVAPEAAAVPLFLQPGAAEVQRVPFGVALILGPWNYPVQLMLCPLIACLAGGNAALLKPSEYAPATARALCELLPCYLDGEAVQVVEGDAAVARSLLAERFDIIFFTGSTRVGRAVAAAAAAQLTPVILELGGACPAVVLADADVPVTARRLVQGKFLNAGQTCVAPNHVLVDAAVAEALVAELGVAITAAFGEDPRRSPDYGRIVNARHLARLQDLIAQGTPAWGGEAVPEERFLAPTVLTGLEPDAPLLREEIFGPILPVLAVADPVEAAVRRGTDASPLALYVFTGEPARAAALAEQVESGGVCINDCVVHLGAESLPFGGVGTSGMGCTRGRWGFEAFTRPRALYRRPLWPDPAVRYAPYTARTRRWLRWLMGR